MMEAQGTVPANLTPQAPTILPIPSTTSTKTASSNKPYVNPSTLAHHVPTDEQKSLAQKMALSRIGDVHESPSAPLDKYQSINSLEKAKKLEALKDNKLNPYLIKDPYDALAHSFHMWKEVAAKTQASPNISFDEQRKIAANYYDSMIAPMYGGLKIEPLSRDLWMKQAYGEALKYKIEDAYNNNTIHDLTHGWNAGLAATARAGNMVTTMLGNGFNDVVAQWRKESAWRAQSDTDRQLELHGQAPKDSFWIHRMGEIDSQLAQSKQPINDNAIQRGAKLQDANHQFWADALPRHNGFIAAMTSGTAEQVAQAPVFAAMSLGSAPLGAEGLTGRLMTSLAGKRVASYLMAGAEGYAYGSAVRKQDDPGEAWRDAVGFAVFHGLFDVAGVGVKKLIDMFPSGSKELARLHARQDALELAQDGKRPATAVERYDDHKTEVANNLFVGGVVGQRAIFVDALHHIQEMETIGPDRARVKAAEAHLLDSDPTRWAPVLSSAKFIRSLLGDKKITEIEPGSAEEKYLSSRMAQLIIDAGSEMNTRVKGMSEQTETEAPKNLAQPSAKNTLAFYMNKAQKELASTPGASTLVTLEQVQKYAQKLYADDLAKSAEVAEKELADDSVKKAQNIAKRSKTSVVKTPLKIRSGRTVNKYGEPSASYSIEPDYKVRLEAHMAAARIKKQPLSEYFKDLSDEDFAHDLSQYFYPKSLKTSKVFFESQATREGMQNPNFLGFMYNYLSRMPKEFGQELENRFTETVKAQKYMSGRVPTEPQLQYYAKAMYNHVDNFLGSGRWPQESNLFRSSNETMWKTTKWQRQLLVEKTLQEQNNLKEMFSGDKKAKRLALSTHAAFSKLRMHEFDNASMRRNSQEHIQAYDSLISNLQTQTKDFQAWVF